jgi:16S rRNA (uracil1498-N3)-methyltransferase
MHRFHAPPSSFEAGRVTLSGDETHHLRDVLRHAAGDEVRVFDGHGNEFVCRIESVRKNGTMLEVIGPARAAAAESPLDLTLAAAVLKGEKLDFVVQKAVELGVRRFIPLQTARGDVRVKDIEKKLQRWRRIGLDAAKQCGRARLMEIGHPSDLTRFLDETVTDGSPTILFAERGGTGLQDLAKCSKITALIGPEGGWDDQELTSASARNVRIVTLDGRIMRAETAAISIAAILQHRFGDLH